MSILENTLSFAVEIAKNIDSYPKVLDHSNNHFAQLVHESVPVLPEGTELEESAWGNAVVKQSATLSPSGISHSRQLDALASLYIKPVVSRMTTLRNTVVPLVDRLAAAVHSQMTKSMPSTPDVQEIKIPDIYANPLYLEFISRHKQVMNTAISAVEFSGGFIDRSETDIVKLMSTGNTSLDNVIAELIASHQDGWLVDVYRRYFVNGTNYPTVLDVMKQLGTVDEAVVIYILLASFITNEIVDGTVNMSMQDYKSYLLDRFAKIGGLLNKYTYAITMKVETGMLVAYIDTQENIIYVYDENYRSFLSQGGNVEMLLGAIITKSPISIKSLLENSTNLVQAYNNDYQTQMRNIRENYIVQMRKGFGIAVVRELKSLPAEDLALFVEVGGQFDPLAQDNTGYINRVASSLSGHFNKCVGEDIYNNVVETVVGYGLAQWGFLSILKNIETFAKEEELEPRQAASLAILHEIAKEVVDSSVTTTGLQ